jgi:hypothetical protein
MENVVRTYKLLISNNIPEDLFVLQYGQELFNHLKKEAFIIDKGRCAGCEHEPPGHKKNDLFFHIYEVNKINPELSKGITLCKACHATQHIENSIKNNWIIFVNSTYDQNNLIRLNRANQTYGLINQKFIVPLKKTPEQFLKEWYSGEAKLTTTLKVIFTNNFNFDDL